MVKQGDSIKLNFNLQSVHEQAGFRPAVVISNDFFNEKVNMTIVCPITNANRSFPLHILLDNRTKTTGFVLCEHIKSIDLEARSYNYVERIPQDLLDEIISTVFSEIEKPE
ncbi:type II toxin-antitoxin system PemK/MazF family toxin [Acetobacterium bakii]|uniref:Toxin MazF n=1 Tax=Acetobacterium bakii TaxID=52689 RepID=A0A0L6U3F2_9FIRM|nr:type II toxin-antitoxin system PemK/MazF family toxin [Acetobacterium bakii]KNZ43046.1 toxin MazF [Acetobacterium bakii]